MEKAKVLVQRDGGKTQTIKVLVNPADYNLQFKPKYARHNVLGGNAPISNFVGSDASSLSMSLYVDGYMMAGDKKPPSDVNPTVKQLVTLTRVDAKLHRPPICTFVWGSLSFEGVIESATVKYTMFESDGRPVRATIDVTFTNVTGNKIPFESPDRTKRRVLTQDTQLYMLSDECYNDCSLWRNIALANGVKNPRKVYAGQNLKVPALLEHE